jgi:ATP synthase F1 gamma subunit
MSNIKQLQSQVQDTNSLKLIAQSYSEISAAKLNKIRASMEHNITFAAELGELYNLVKTEAVRRKLPLTPKTPGVVHVLLTSNNRFYGQLERPLARYFATATTNFISQNPNTPCQVIVVGKTGVSFLGGLSYSLKYQSVSFKDDLPAPSEFKALTDSIKQYQTVLVYHSRFKTVLTQLPVISDVTKSVIRVQETKEPIKYIFEPELDLILKFFEGQIFEILFDQTLLESDLARTAARLTSMNGAEENAAGLLKTQKRLLGRAQKSLSDSKMLEMIIALHSMGGQNHGQR